MSRAIRNIAIIAHVDHGKTTLVDKLLSQTATFASHQHIAERVMDNNDLEKERGITIDLGFAHLELPGPSGPVRLGFVDVPGHERFVRNMLAGVGGMDLVMLVISAEDGVMPQTREAIDHARAAKVPIVVAMNKK